MTNFLAQLGIGPYSGGYSDYSTTNWSNGSTYHNSGWSDRSWENHTVERYEGKRDDATRNWMIGGLVGNFLANSIAQDDPDGARAIGSLANLAFGIGQIRDAGRERYHYENHNYGRETNAWNTTQEFWSGGSTNNVWETYNYNPWICY